MKAIFESSLEGHRIEYIYHICEFIKNNNIPDVLVFAPFNFYDVLYERLNIQKDKPYSFFQPIGKNDLYLQFHKKKFRNGYAEIKLLKRLCKTFDITEFFILSFGFILDILPIVNTTFKLSGIKYHLNDDIIYREKHSRNLKSKIKQFLFANNLNSSKFKGLYILNNPNLVNSLKNSYNSSKFFMLNDPVLNLKNFFNNETLKSSEKKIRFVHIGSLTKRKGTKDLISAVKNVPSSYQNKFEIIIAGKASDEYQMVLQNEINAVNKQTGFNNITLINKFLSTKELSNYLNLSDYIILPYKLTEMSSGIVGHAINYNKPLIVPDSGFYKQLLEQYQVGFPIERGIDGIANAIRKAIDKGFEYDIKSAEKFLERNSPEAFASTIINSFNH